MDGSCQKFDGSIPNQIWKNPNVPISLNSNLLALESVISTQVVADNLKVVRATREAFIQNESSEKIKHAHQIRTSEDDAYTTGDLMFCKRENSEQWHGQGTIISHNGKQILVKHGSSYVRVHTCRVAHAINSDQKTNRGYRKDWQ